MKKTFLISILFCVLTLLVAGSSHALTLSFAPSDQTIGIGDTALVDLNISELGDYDAPSLGAFYVEITFDDSILAFDTGPGNAPMNDWVCELIGQDMDRDGALAKKGTADEARIAKALDNPFFNRTPPKSLDRQEFDPKLAEGLSLEDGTATLTAFTARAIAKAADHFPAPASTWVVTGGGRLNPVLMESLGVATGAQVLPVEALGWNGDALEAQAFAYLAVRSHLGLPITFPTTTGVAEPITGGTLHPMS